ncbi:hypothetical protein COT03_02140 [Candidatus Shapirobacteria bacterium CG07_land_8_20_14_0_80_39_18]|uniref:DUF333 domain-containing protein n=1 Tax=Candidatus Shapirobacteria bacterium CG07_land_8_20_14_0_80_39_18 TaxID=1974882 RepID=A0A2M6YR64_9BACT|nr:MAG: hypothetical protein COT03_02140 [Candidatus Shapirobacteria bacterium CG07_land_8_20_14_0_80_39_18]
MAMMKKISLGILGVILVVLIVIVGARVLSPEDNWICQNGEWVKHGNPSGPMPSGSCKEGEQMASNKVPTEAAIPNPASKNCLDKGGKLEMREETAGTLGICKFTDGTECEEWKFYRNECRKGQTTKADTSHSYEGLISRKGNDYVFKTNSGIEYSLKLPDNASQNLKDRLASEVGRKETVTIVAAETPPLSKILFLSSFQEK